MKKGLGYLGCLFFVVGLCLTNIQPIKAQQIEICILEDGNIEPITASIQRTGELYTLANDVDYSIIVERDNTILDGNGYAVSSLNLVQRTNTTIKNVDSNIWLVNTSNSVIQGCQGNIRLDNSFNNNIYENNFKSNPNGILLINSNNNIIQKNTITGVIQGPIGFSLVSSQNNSIYENNIVNNSVGLGLSDNSIHNSIIRNNFINNTQQAGDLDSSPNIWNDGMLGNYWSDYDGLDTNSTGIGDFPYIIGENNQDNFPSMTPISIPHWNIEYRGFYIQKVDNNYIVSENLFETYISPLFSSIEETKDWIDEGPTSIPKPNEPEFPTTIASITIIAIIGIGLLVYFKKYRK